MSEFEDVTRIDKFQISEQEYDKRADSFRKFRERQLKTNPNFQCYLGQVDVDFEKDEALQIQKGMRCETKVGGKRGEVKYIGKVNGLERGYWIGVKLDEPTGDTNGSVKGFKALFECPPKFGIFVRPTDLNVGDYPEIDDFDEENDMI